MGAAYEIISTGSQEGNCVTLFNHKVMIDLGVKTTNARLKEVLPKVEHLILTHEHGDHIHLPTLRYVVNNHPSIKIHGGKFIQDYIRAQGKIDTQVNVLEADKVYHVDSYLILSPFKLEHDVPNFGYHVYFVGNRLSNSLNTKSFKAIYVTDTGRYPKELKAPNYHLYLLEMNYDEERLDELINKEINEIGFSHRIRSKETHLSMQETEVFWKKQGGQGILVPLHMSKDFRTYITERYK